jgi:steroid delta-isomerase-like uncharacterized protein
VGTQENKATVRSFIEEAFNKGNVAAIDELIADNYVNHTGGNEVRGREAMKAFVRTYRSAFPDYHCTIEDQIADGDKVVTRWTVRGTQEGELMGIPPTGKRIYLGGIVIDRLANGRLVETWHQADVIGMLQQLGVAPTPEQASV